LGGRESLVHHIVMMERVFRDANYFDIIHFHCDYLHFPLSHRHTTPNVTTLHGRLDLADLVPLTWNSPKSHWSPSPTTNDLRFLG
jgi:hypothetical protein